MTESDDQTTIAARVTPAQRYDADVMMDVFVYTVVLNLFVEFVDSIVIDSFTVSLLTAIVMKFMIDLINELVGRVKAYFADREGDIPRDRHDGRPAPRHGSVRPARWFRLGILRAGERL